MKRVLETAGPAAAIVSGLPVIVPPVVVMATEFADPRLETTLPRLSVTATLAVKVPLLPSEVTVQVKRQGEPRVPALTVGADQAYLAAAPADTVRARALVVEIEPSVADSVVAPAFAALKTPFFGRLTVATPEVKVRTVAEPTLIAAPELLDTEAAVPFGLASGPEKVSLRSPA